MANPETVYCRRCQKDVQYHYDPVNHWKQLLLTIMTLGLWLPMWFCVAFGPTKLCNECGGPLWAETGRPQGEVTATRKYRAETARRRA